MLGAAVARPAVANRGDSPVGARKVDHDLVWGRSCGNVDEGPVVGRGRRAAITSDTDGGIESCGIAAPESALALLQAEARGVRQHLHLATDAPVQLVLDCDVSRIVRLDLCVSE